MLLVAGGQLDPNIGSLLRRCLEREVVFRDLLVGPDLCPELKIDLDGRLSLGGVDLAPSACFVRHDVFLAQRTGTLEDTRAALNWYHAVRDWAVADPAVQLLNRSAQSIDLGKYAVLRRALDHGLRVPATVVATDQGSAPPGEAIRKPVAGGELTTLVDRAGPPLPYPHFLQQRLHRPELRVYRVGRALAGFAVNSPDLDYRARHDVTLAVADVPEDLGRRYLALADDLGLDFAAADFMRDASGAWVFLEINSQPMFAAFDRLAGGLVSDMILDWLLDRLTG